MLKKHTQENENLPIWQKRNGRENFCHCFCFYDFDNTITTCTKFDCLLSSNIYHPHFTLPRTTRDAQLLAMKI